MKYSTGVIYRRIGIGLLCGVLLTPVIQAQPLIRVDLATVNTSDGLLHRTYGSRRDGLSSTRGDKGTPVAGGFDMDGDGFADYAVSSIQASPLGRTQAGEVFLVFGDGQIQGTVDTSTDQPRLLRIVGASPYEHAGSEITMDDITGDGLGDLLICRQDFSPVGGPVGAGALSVVAGSASLRTLAQNAEPLDLANPPGDVTVFTLVGGSVQERLCIWARTGDVDGDTIADVVIGADQRDGGGGDTHQGALYVLRGGDELAASTRQMSVNSPPADLQGDLTLLTPPPGSLEYHLGATCQIADLDGNGRGEVLGAATLSRSGASLGPANPPEIVHASGGAPNGAVLIFWDDNFSAGDGTWPASIRFDQATGATTRLRGASNNVRFGEEILGGLDYDHDGNADLFIGDLVASPPPDAQGNSRGLGGIGDVIYHARSLKGLTVTLNPSVPPAGTGVTRFYGPIARAIAADTALHGDFNGDGIDDLAFGSPDDDPLGRTGAGTLHVFWGQQGRWPTLVDLAPGSHPSPVEVQITEVYGVRGTTGSDIGDMLVYSAAAGDIDGDGRIDAIVNEMTGNGLAANTVDVGNLLVISGDLLIPRIFADGFE